MDSPIKKLKILAVHGYRQNGETFRQKTGSFRKIIQKYAHFTFISAPHKVINIPENAKDNTSSEQTVNTEQYSWWFNRDDHTFKGSREGGPALGFEESVKLVEEIFEKHGPFDGVLGFSQGACFVGLLCDLQSRGLTSIKFDFAIMAAGFKSGSLAHLKFFSEPLDIPSMHIYGESDEIIPKAMSLSLKEAFEGSDYLVEVQHSGGHFLPGTKAQKSDYIDFFKEMISRRNIRESKEA